MTKEEIVQGLYRGDNKAIKEAIKALEQRPSDCVSMEVYKQVAKERDIAIEQLKELGYELGEKIRTSDDCVSRKAVDLLCFKYLKPNNDDNVAFYEHFCDLPPVTPTFQSSEDCVSRQAVLAIAGDSCLDLDNYEDTKEFCDAINELPSVTPTRCIAEIKFSKDDLREICNERIEVECTHGTCKDCKHWKDSDGVYRRGVGAESKCPINIKEVYEGNFYCKWFEKRGSENEVD